MVVPDELRARRHGELAECFAVIDTCLATYYGGAKHMYRALAGQLRILLCDKPPLLSRVFPDLAIGALRPIEWLEPIRTGFRWRTLSSIRQVRHCDSTSGWTNSS